MSNITDVQMAEWLQILESDPWEDELSGLARKAIPILCAEVERLRADQLRWAELGAQAMQEFLINDVSTLMESDFDKSMVRVAIQTVDPAAVARRAVDAEGGNPESRER